MKREIILICKEICKNEKDFLDCFVNCLKKSGIEDVTDSVIIEAIEEKEE